MKELTEKQISDRAYESWEQAGRAENRDDEFWHHAELDLQRKLEDSESTIVPG